MHKFSTIFGLIWFSVCIEQRRHERYDSVSIISRGNMMSSPVKNVWNSNVGTRWMSGKSMRSRVAARMQNESSKTLREIRRSKKLKLKLMTDEERLIYNLRRVSPIVPKLFTPKCGRWYEDYHWHRSQILLFLLIIICLFVIFNG